MAALDIFQSVVVLGFLGRGAGRNGLQLAERGSEDGAGGEDEGALEEIFEFADIAGPVPLDQGVHGFGGDAGDVLANALRDLTNEVLDE